MVEEEELGDGDDGRLEEATTAAVVVRVVVVLNRSD